LFYIEFVVLLIWSLLLIISVLVSVTFLTLLEREVIGYIQIHKGPNKVGIIGIPQPFCDAIKLFTKEQTSIIFKYLKYEYYISPIFSLFAIIGFTLNGELITNNNLKQWKLVLLMWEFQ